MRRIYMDNFSAEEARERFRDISHVIEYLKPEEFIARYCDCGWEN